MTDDTLRAEVALTLKRKPWLQALPDSIWVVWGMGRTYYSEEGRKPIEITYHESLCVVRDEGDGPVFMPIYGGFGFPMILPDDIERAFELLLVSADDPRQPYWDRDQARMDGALR